ncbi:MAG: Phospholipase D/transphosphatidylase [Candidatus Collierbacteria bacterium GW2011_GWC2_44_18]|uniref:phospholipase D n=4 Tax=Microgenomates group TaxID=1794810 RepID=A0A2H0VID0_9BACT|nr:MAG: phospholipase D/transphosphatidylase [Microgenomates group bacterium GW2011_GWC1_44_10]KKT49170.1 MAG: Phospholipase D/transphosphatidylase [Candidatus Collierbacteria bacterium GW2011_GWC2_44_18]KKT67339.1 MAG: Phospholipase D/transphosphatidylase [Candidatus Woesebacteria bacterium GW2011_GWA2_44_33]PIR98864.1 MAG: phospholipase [Candidatus Collierbacteria bacterium CG10_big_fil_rev_8_21_14_0_10_44_9]
MPKQHTKHQWLYPFLVLIFVAVYYALTSSPSGRVVPDFSSPTPVVLGATNTPVHETQASWYEVYFTNPKIPFDDNFTGGIESVLIEKINQADTSIDLAVYEFNLENVVQALIAAQGRGVRVRVVYDNEFTDPDLQISELKNAGIQAIPDERSAFMHNKFFIFDGQCIWTGSFNISINAAYRNNENALYFCSSEAAQNYTIEFEEMNGSQFGTTSPADTPYPVFVINGVKVENYFAPEDHVMEHIISEISSAQNYVHFMVFSFTHNGLGQAMIDDLRRGVGIVGIFETRGAASQYSQCLPLLLQGAEITLDGNPRTFHHKVIIIDGQIVITGSFNFSDSADQENDENLLIIHDPSLAAAYEKEFQRMKSMSRVIQGNSCTTQ